MRKLVRVLAFGSVSGLLWAIVPGTLADLFSSRADVPLTIAAGVLAGIVTSVVLALLVERVGRGVTVILGLLSLPFGAFVFGFGFAVIARLIPTLASGSRTFMEPWTLGLNYAALSVISVFAVALFPLAVITTLVLRWFIFRARTAEPSF